MCVSSHIVVRCYLLLCIFHEFCFIPDTSGTTEAFQTWWIRSLHAFIFSFLIFFVKFCKITGRRGPPLIFSLRSFVINKIARGPQATAKVRSMFESEFRIVILTSKKVRSVLLKIPSLAEPSDLTKPGLHYLPFSILVLVSFNSYIHFPFQCQFQPRKQLLSYSLKCERSRQTSLLHCTP